MSGTIGVFAGVHSGPKCIGPGSHQLSEYSRSLLLPQYTRCIRWPQVAAGNLQGECSVLHSPTKNLYKKPLDDFRNISQVTVDVSACQSFVDDFAPPNLDRAALSPLNVTLRPHSTDHAVFLQARLPICISDSSIYDLYHWCVASVM